MAHRIFLVDDDDDIRACMRMILEDEGYEVEEAPDGLSALELLRRRRPDLLLLDYKMPGMNAPELLQQARAEGLTGGYPVLLITAAEDPRDAADRARPDGVLSKPFELDELLAHVSERLAPVGHGTTR